MEENGKIGHPCIKGDDTDSVFFLIRIDSGNSNVSIMV